MNEIESMLSVATQDYYGGMYIDFQEKVREPDSKFYNDYEMVCNQIANLEGIRNLVDVGSGNCRWFKFFEHKVANYFAIEVNKAASSLAPKNPKLAQINQNVFDANFELSKFVEVEVDMVFLGFFLSHFTDTSIQVLLGKLKSVDRLIIVDSFWGSIHQARYTTKGLKYIKRRFSATEKVFLPKRFFDNSDIGKLVNPFGYFLKKFVKGNYWFVCEAEKNSTKKISGQM